MGTIDTAGGTEPAITIPMRTSSKRALTTLNLDELRTAKNALDHQVSKKRKLLKPRSSCDSEYWTNAVELNDLTIEQNDHEAMLAFHKTARNDDDLSFEQWQNLNPIGIDLSTQRAALETIRSIAASHATSLESEAGLTQSFLKLFFGAPSGFNIGGASAGQRNNQEQSLMRDEMIRVYNEGETTAIWEPVIGMMLPTQLVTAAHLYPWRSAEHIDTIFGKGSIKELMTPCNGLLLASSIENMLDRGYIAIVPDVEMEPLDDNNPRGDLTRRRDLIKGWESSWPREYRIVILDQCKGFKNAMDEILRFPNLYGIKNLQEMEGRRLKFRNSFRPRARYVWWTYLNAIAQVTFRYKNQRNIGFQREVTRANRYWGTAGSYVKKNMLSGFNKHIGQDLDGIRDALLGPDAVIDDEETSDNTAMSVLAKETIRKTSLSLQEAGVVEEESSSEDEAASE